MPKANNIIISVLTDGAKGYLKITGDGIPNHTIIEASKRGRLNIFYINRAIGRGLKRDDVIKIYAVKNLSLIHISEPTRQCCTSRMPSSA